MNLLKNPDQEEFDFFFEIIDHSESFVRKVTKSAFCKAWKTTESKAFTKLNPETIEGPRFISLSYGKPIWGSHGQYPDYR